MENKKLNERECVIVPIAWFEELLKMADFVSNEPNSLVKQAALMGYIKSATHIIKHNEKI